MPQKTMGRPGKSRPARALSSRRVVSRSSRSRQAVTGIFSLAAHPPQMMTRPEAFFGHPAVDVEVNGDGLFPLKPGEAERPQSHRLFGVRRAENLLHFLFRHAELHLLVLVPEGSTRLPRLKDDGPKDEAG